jgi:beta-lactam-binding protein with PASTA domain
VPSGFPSSAKVPSVVGLREDVAVAELGRAGLRSVVRPEAVSDGSGDGIVIRQFPAPGLRVLAGTAVSLIVGRYAGPKSSY